MVGGAQGGANHRAPGREVTYRGGDPIEILRVLRPHQRCAAPWARNGSGGYPRWCFNFPDRPRRMGAEALPADRLEMRSRRRSAAVREDRRRRRSALQASRAISVRPNHVNGTGPRALLDRSRDAFATKAGNRNLLVEASLWSSATRPQTTQAPTVDVPFESCMWHRCLQPIKSPAVSARMGLRARSCHEPIRLTVSIDDRRRWPSAQMQQPAAATSSLAAS